MGYTHQYLLSRAPSLKRWRVFAAETLAILSHPKVKDLVCFECDEPDRPPQVDDELIQFNGKGELGHETFILVRGEQSGFCKTGGIAQSNLVDQWGKDYDLPVATVLLSAHRLIGLRLRSDGDWGDEPWLRAGVLYGAITDTLPTCPWPEKTCTGCRRAFHRDSHNWGGHEVCAKCGCGSSHGYGGVTRCMNCGSTKRGHKASTSLCYFCSNGYKSKQEAADDIKRRMDELFLALRSTTSAGNRLTLVTGD